MELVVVVIAMFVAAVAQRVTGMGFALMAAPPLIIVTGPLTGVMLAVLAGGVASLFIIWRMWRDIQWSRAIGLTVTSVIGVAIGAVLAAQAPRPVLQIVIGLIVLAALGIAPLMARRRPIPGGALSLSVTGFTAGLLNAGAGLSGPPVTVYAVLTRWPQRAFAATLQPFFIVITAVTLAMKVFLTPDAWPQLEWWAWLAMLGVVVGGLLLGDWLTKHVPDRLARRAVILIAAAGAIATIIDGVLAGVA